jgi:membrane protein
MKALLTQETWKAWLTAQCRKVGGGLKFFKEVVKDSLLNWSQNGTNLHAAALAFYTLLSLAPLVVLTVAVASHFFSYPSVEARIFVEVEDRIGPEAANYVLGVIRSNRQEYSGEFTTILSLLVLLYGASTLFYQLQVSLNIIWGFPTPGQNLKQSLISLLKTRSLAALFALSFGALLMISLLLQTILEFLPKQYIYKFLPGLEQYRWIFSLLAPFILLMLVFLLLFKILLGKRAQWRHVWPGAALAAVLFWVGQSIFDLYFASSAVSHIYGTAGSVVIVMLWAYYAAIILLFGAKFTWVYICKRTSYAPGTVKEPKKPV